MLYSLRCTCVQVTVSCSQVSRIMKLCWTLKPVLANPIPCLTKWDQLACREYARLVGGIWLDPDRNRVCVFNWKPDCISGTELAFRSMSAPPLTAPFQRLAPDGVASVHFVNDENCWLKQYKVQEGRLVPPPSQAAQAATTVAIGQYSVRYQPSS